MADGAKWGKVIGPAALKEWRVACRNVDPKWGKQDRFAAKILSLIWPSFWTRSSKVIDVNDGGNEKKRSNCLPFDSLMPCYLALENGKFWFPAQVYNRGNGHVGFILSYYDAELSYDSHTHTFRARYRPHGKRFIAVDSGVSWERLRAPPVDIASHDLLISDCLNDLCPGDHIEIQWRRNKEFPYGWWYGIVGHLESCDGNENYCWCNESDIVVLEFHQYTIGSRWRKTMINRKDHREEGNEADGFYGGIRKLYDHEEISRWKQFWPSHSLE